MSTNNIDELKTMTDVENTLYILQTLSTTESQDLEYAVIEVYYESDSVSKSGWRYDMPMIADAAIKTIIEQADKIAELEANQASDFLKFVKSSDKIGNITKLQFHALFVAFKQAGDS